MRSMARRRSELSKTFLSAISVFPVNSSVPWVLIKLAAARANMDLRLLDKKVGRAIVQAAQEVIDGKS